MLALVTLGLPLLAIGSAVVGVVVVLAIAKSGGTNPAGVFEWLLLPLGSLARALLPFAFVVLVIGGFATAQVGWVAQVISGLGLALLVWLFLRKRGPLRFERHQTGQLLATGWIYFIRLLNRAQWTQRATWVRTSSHANAAPPLSPGGRSAYLPWLGLGLGLAAVLLVFGPRDRDPDFPRVSDTAELAARLAIIVLLFAIPFRLVGYATTRIRAGISGLVALLLWRELTWAGVLHGETHVDWLPAKWTALALLVAILALLVWEGSQYWPSPHPTDGHRITRAIGFILAAASALALAIGLFSASLAVTKVGNPKLDNTADPTVQPQVVELSDDPDLNLAWTYAPVLRLHDQERYPPISVDTFLQNATTHGAAGDGSGRTVDLGTLPDRCADRSQERCAHLDCPGCITFKRQSHPTGYSPQGIFYARVIHRGSEPRAFAGWNPWGRNLNLLIQYWIFYGYDSWQAATPIGDLTQEHQGDWEHVTVGLTTATRRQRSDRELTTPRFVALSAHCGGQVVDWGNVHAAYATGRLESDSVTRKPRLVFTDNDVPGKEATHPIVAVARGSHANYALSTDNRPPDWGSCNNLPTEPIEAFSYAASIRDLTDTNNTGWYVYPHGITTVTADKPPMSYPGTWSKEETVTFGHAPPHRIGAGPPSPPLQGQIWVTPIRSYFCGPRWRERGDTIAGHPALHGNSDQC